MPPIIKVSDQTICAATAEYPYAKWKFESFNPVQSRVLDFYNQDCNGLIAARTSAGKTIVAEIMLAEEVRKRGGKGMFLAPLRALAREKVTDWTSPDHHFGDLKVSICTGDYRLTKERTNELNDANIIIMTSEMLSHRSRSNTSEQSQFLKDVGTLVIDESHLLTVKGRGDHLEVGLMKFTQINPKARLVLLSATMPNVEEIAEWVSYSLNQKETFVLRSDYRPVPLTTHYETYDDSLKRYDLIEQEKINKALDIIDWYKDDKFLVFSHTKRTGELMKKELMSSGIECQFHNADLESAERAKVEDRFKNDPKLRVIVATSTLAWGCYGQGTPVLMANNTIKKIEDVCIGDYVCGMSNEGFQSFAVTMVGPKQVERALRFELSSGEVVDVSCDHKFYGAIERMVPDYYEASRFAVGDYVAVPSEFPQDEIIPSDDYGYLYGYVMGDGSKCKCGSFKDGTDKVVLDIAFGSSELHHLHYVRNLFDKVFSSTVFTKERLDTNGVYHLVTKKRNIVSHFNMMRSGRHKEDLSLFNLPRNDKSFIKGVIQGLFDTDGGFSSHGNGYTSLEFTTISQNLAAQVQQYLLFFGVRSSVGKKKVKDSVINGRYQVARREFIYRVRIYGKQVANYLKFVGFRNNDKRLYGEYLLEHPIKGQEKNIVPVRSLLKEHAEANNITLNALCKRVKIDYWNVLNKTDIKIETLDKILDYYPNNSNLNLLKSKNIRFSRIKKIESVASQTMFDIAVDSVENYVGGGVVSHNCNFPARRVIILGVHRGVEEVESYDILQMIGRSGRYGIDPMGDAYILVPESDVNKYKAKFSKSNRIESQLLEKVGNNYKTLAFHLVSEIFFGGIETTDDVHKWFKRSLAYFQNKTFDDSIVDSTLDLLRKCGAIIQEEGIWKARTIGKVASMFYMSPFDVSDLYFNFSKLFESGKQDDDHHLSMALGNIDSQRSNIVNRQEKDEMNSYATKVRISNGFLMDGAIKAGYCYHLLLSGANSQACASFQRNLQNDFNRISQVLFALDSMGGQWKKVGWLKTLEGRIAYGVPAHLIGLCAIPNIGKVRATKLYEAGIKSAKDFAKTDVEKLSKIINMKSESVKQMIEQAQDL